MIIVGDVHGCHSEMVTLLKRCGYRLGNQDERERFSVVLAGDLVNKVLSTPRQSFSKDTCTCERFCIHSYTFNECETKNLLGLGERKQKPDYCSRVIETCSVPGSGKR